MSDTKHTPGPWANAGYADGSHYICTENGQAIAYVELPIHDSKGLTKVQSDANARLIAAAPDLLAALKISIRDAQIAYEVMSKANKDMGFTPPTLPAWLVIAEAALQKAL